MRHAAAKVATRHHRYQHSRHNSQRAGPVATCNISSKAAAAQVSPLPPSLSLLALLPQRGSCCIFFSRIEFGMLSTQMRLCRRRPQVAAAEAAVLAAAAHVACHRRQPGSEPTKSCCYFRQQFQLHYTRLSCLLWLPHNGDVFVFASAIS